MLFMIEKMSPKNFIEKTIKIKRSKNKEIHKKLENNKIHKELILIPQYFSSKFVENTTTSIYTKN